MQMIFLFEKVYLHGAFKNWLLVLPLTDPVECSTYPRRTGIRRGGAVQSLHVHLHVHIPVLGMCCQR